MNYFYEAVDNTGNTVLGKIEAENEAEAQSQLMAQGFQVQALGMTMEVPSRPVPVVPDFAPVATALRRPITEGTVRTVGQEIGAVNAQGVAVAPAPRRVGGITLAGNAAQTAAKLRLPTQQREKVTPASPSGVAPAGEVSKLGGVSTKDQMLFFQQLAALVKGGTSIYSALENLAARTSNKNLALTAREMHEQAHQGGAISEVMARYPRIYPDHVVGLVRAGEMGGFLEIALAEVADAYEKNIALYRWAWIPKFMAIQAVFVAFIGWSFFRTLFSGENLVANLLVWLKFLLIRDIPLALLFLGGVIWASRRLQLPQHRRTRDAWSLKIQPFGTLQRQAALTHFLRVLGRLYKAGLSPSQAWEGAMNTASNVVIREQLASANDLIAKGASLPEAFAATGLFTNSVENMILTGHQSGEVVEMLERATTYYQEQADQAASKSRFMLFRLGVLALLVIGGGTLCWMTYTYFHGIFQFVDSFLPTD